jgi:hypothetical protein
MAAVIPGRVPIDPAFHKSRNRRLAPWRRDKTASPAFSFPATVCFVIPSFDHAGQT